MGISDSAETGTHMFCLLSLRLTLVQADDGILDNSDPHGNVMFTPNAKKTYA